MVGKSTRRPSAGNLPALSLWQTGGLDLPKLNVRTQAAQPWRFGEMSEAKGWARRRTHCEQ